MNTKPDDTPTPDPLKGLRGPSETISELRADVSRLREQADLVAPTIRTLNDRNIAAEAEVSRLREEMAKWKRELARQNEFLVDKLIADKKLAEADVSRLQQENARLKESR